MKVTYGLDLEQNGPGGYCLITVDSAFEAFKKLLDAFNSTSAASQFDVVVLKTAQLANYHSNLI